MVDWVLVNEAEEQSGYSANHIRLLVRTKTIEGRKVGGVWLVDIDSLLQYKQQMDEEGVSKFDPTKKRRFNEEA